jgi:MFS family permease
MPVTVSTARTSLHGLLPPSPGSRRLALASFTDAIGTALYVAGAIPYLTRVAGWTTSDVGAGLSAAAVAGFVFTTPMGVLSDRLGSRRALILIHLWRGAVFALYAFTKGLFPVLVLLCLIVIADRAATPAMQALVGAITDENSRVRTLAFMRSVSNIGFSAGALLAAAALMTGSTTVYRMVVLGNAASFIGAAVLLTSVRMAGTAPLRRPAMPLRAALSFRDGPYALLSGLNGILALNVTMLSVGIPLVVTQHPRAPKAIIGILLLANTVIAVLFQIPAAKGARTPHGSSGAMAKSGVALMLCCLLLAPTAYLPVNTAIAFWAAAIIALTFGELWYSAGGWGLSYDLARTERRTQYLSVFSLGKTAQMIVGPTLLSAVVIAKGPVGWLGLGAVFLATGFVIRPVARRLDERRSWEESSAAAADPARTRRRDPV